MTLAIKKAKKSSEPLKCGAVIVKDGKIVAVAYNTAHKKNDASAHAEINAIRKANKKLSSKYLENCTIYCTCEPCIMCLTAISYAKISRVVYGLTLKNVTPKEKLIDIPLELFLEKSPHKIEVTRNFMEEDCKSLLV